MYPGNLLPCLIAGLALSGAARAGSYNVSPTNLALGEGNPSAILTVDNQGSEALRFHVTGFAWDETDGGEMQLDPTGDLVVFPTLFSLEPGASRQIRIGTTLPAGAAEGTYRLIVEELPPLATDGQVGVLVRTRMSVPVFLAPARPTYEGAAAAPVVTDGAVDVGFANDGTMHVRAQRIEVDGRDAAGASVFTGSVDGWYVLPGHVRTFAVPLPDGVCAALRTVRATVTTDHGSWRSEAAVDPAACER